jgi:organic radical activating enzyme
VSIEHVIPTETALRPRAPGTYVINEVFYSLQGEGIRAGEPMVFVRFADCNLRCLKATAGFDCDTDFASGEEMPAPAVVAMAEGVLAANRGGVPANERPRILFTGGEPSLQLDQPLIDAFEVAGWRKFGIETNGTIDLSHIWAGDFHVCVSPKSAEHTLRQLVAREVKYVRGHGQALPEPRVKAEHYLLSPAAQADGSFRREDLAWVIDLVKANPKWRFSLQMHKLLGVR